MYDKKIELWEKKKERIALVTGLSTRKDVKLSTNRCIKAIMDK